VDWECRPYIEARGGMIVRSFGSGSSGNALVVETADATVLVDCGLSAATIARGMKTGGRSLDSVSAVVISHEHVDHVRGLQRVLKAGTPLIASPGTHQALDVGRVPFRPLRSGDAEEIEGNVTVRALGVSHDAAEPCGFCIDAGGVRLTVITDLGIADPELAEWIASSDLIVLEANHDEEMLRRGPYPAHLKRRVLSATGHLSNRDCGQLLQRALAGSDRRRTIWLAHLSATNNRPDLAVATVMSALAGVGAKHDVRALPRQGLPVVWRSDEPVGSLTRPHQLSLF
jgi:phosphoribosyl 1,2-cyclic phosphodiesterase